MSWKKKCPECGKTVPYHYNFTSHSGVFCNEECCHKYEEKPKNENYTRACSNLEYLEKRADAISSKIKVFITNSNNPYRVIIGVGDENCYKTMQEMEAFLTGVDEFSKA